MTEHSTLGGLTNKNFTPIPRLPLSFCFSQAVKYPSKREVREFNGKQYLMEEAIKGDVAFIRAWKVDEAGNVVFRYAAHNFSAAMARSARMTIVEVSSPTCCDRGFYVGSVETHRKLTRSACIALSSYCDCRRKRSYLSARSTRWRSTFQGST